MSVCLRVSVWIQLVENLQIFPNPAKLVASCELCARRTDWSVTRSDVKASLARSKLRPRTVRPPPPGGSRPPLLWKNSPYAVSISTQIALFLLKLLQTSSKSRLSFVCAKIEAMEDFSFCHWRLSQLSKQSPHGLSFVRVVRMSPIFPFVRLPSNVLLGIGICGRRRDYLGSAVTRDTGDPWESTTATQCRGRLMLVHNSFKHHLEVETRLPIIHQTHRNHRRLFLKNF